MRAVPGPLSTKQDTDGKAAMTERMKAPTIQQCRRAAFKLHSLIVRDAGTGCAAADILPGICNGALQCAHLVSKEQAGWVALDQINGVTLCAKHHMVIDSNRHRWLILISELDLVSLVLELQAENDRAKSHEPRRGVDWWRHELLRLWHFCECFDIDTESVPQYVHVWCRRQISTQEMNR